MYTNPEEFGEEFAHKLRVWIECLDRDVFCEAKLTGFNIPLCPVIVSAAPDDWPDAEFMDVATVFSYKHDAPSIVWNNYEFQNAYFVWTSAIAQLVSRLRKGEFIAQPTFERKLAVCAMLLVRKRIACYCRAFSRFRYYVLDDLPTEIQGAIFTDNFFKESITGKNHERVDQLVLLRLLHLTLSESVGEKDYLAPAIIDLLVNRNTSSKSALS